MQKNKYSFSLNTTLLSICAYLFIGLVFGVLSGCLGKSEQAQASYESGSGKRNTVEIPKIGEIVTTERASELCVHYGMNRLAERIDDSPDVFKEWKFDGCSMTPTEVLSEIIKVSSLAEICLRHDLGYAYGEPGNDKKRLIVDKTFQNELISAGASEFVAKVMFDAVRAGGKEELCLPFSWGFARMVPCKPGVGLILKQ